MATISGVITAMVTPFTEDGALDLDAARSLARHLVENGSHGLVVAGTTGESPTLSDAEKLSLLKAVKEEVGDQATIVCGTGSNDTRHSVELTDGACRLGADAVLVVTPYYNKPNRAGLRAHFEAVAEAAGDTPVILYNIPSRCVINLPPDFLAELAAEIPNVVAVKQANDDLDQARRILAETDLDLYAGDDNLIYPFLELGGVGGVCVHTHVVGPQVKQMIRSFRDGDAQTAKRIDQELGPAYELLKVQTNPIAIKAALNLAGHRVGGLRLPLVEASDDEVARVRSCLERLGVLSAAPA